jgi:hypothetical protein
MVELRPLIVVTGTLRVEGGLKRARKKATTKGAQIMVTESLNIGEDRRAGNVVAARYLRKLAGLKIVHTPYGSLVDPENLVRVKDTIAQATIDCQAFNREHEKCKVSNTMLWEHLRGMRLDAITAWIDKHMREGDEDVTKVLARLVAAQAA